MALWNLPEDDFLSKRRGERGGASAFKRKATTSQKSTGKKASNQYSKKLTSSSNKKKKYTVAPKQATRKRETEAQASRIRNACVAVICVIFLAVFLADFKGCSSTKKTSSFELPIFSLSSVIDSIADAISGGSHSSSNSYDYSYDPLNYVTEHFIGRWRFVHLSISNSRDEEQR